MPPLAAIETFTYLVHKCKQERSQIHAIYLSNCMHMFGLEAHRYLGNPIIFMLMDLGNMCDAQKVFDKMMPQNECSWNSLIVRYVKCGKFQQALIMYQEVQEAPLYPNEYALAALLKACTELMDFQSGFEIHAEIAKTGLLEHDLFVGNTLVDMYVRFGSLAEAQVVFDALPVHDVVSWNILITGYVKHHCGEEALSLLKLMQVEGISPNVVTFISSLKVCSIAGAIDKGLQIHAKVARLGLLQRDIAVGNALVDMYAKCGSLAQAHDVFDRLVVRDVISWNALMAGYAKHEHAKEVLCCLEQMQIEGVFADAVTLACGLKAIGILGHPNEGRKIHLWVATKGLLEKDLVVGNTLLDMYATCGFFEKAEQVFNKLVVRDVVSWTAMIAGYAEHDRETDALFYFEQMQHEGVIPNAVTFVCILKACGSIGAMIKGQEIHVKVAIVGLLERNIIVGNSLVDMYARCGMFEKAYKVFGKLPCRDIASWNALIAGYTQKEQWKEALICLKRMQLEGVTPDAITFVCALNACGSIGDKEEGTNFESEIYRKGLLCDVFVGNALVSFYAKCGSFLKVDDILDKLPVQDVVSWTTVMAGYVKQGQGEDALMCYEQMQVKGVSPDAVTFVCSLKACGIVGVMEKGKEIHAEIAKMGLLEGNLFICSALVDMYFKCGRVAEAQQVFNQLPVRDVVLWTALLAGYADHERCMEAVNIYEQMEFEGVSPDMVTFICGMKACGIIGATGKGTEIHADIVGKGLLEEGHPIVGNALVSMYAKWGVLIKAQEAFDKLPFQDVNGWNALISGYAQQGEVENVFCMFNRMIEGGEKPNIVTFTGVLNACGYIGLVNKGKMFFEVMSQEHGISPTLEHHTCFIDLHIHAGYLDKGEVMIRNMPFYADLTVWRSVLHACQKLGDIDRGEMVFGHALQVCKKDNVSVC